MSVHEGNKSTDVFYQVSSVRFFFVVVVVAVVGIVGFYFFPKVSVFFLFWFSLGLFFSFLFLFRNSLISLVHLGTYRIWRGNWLLQDKQ